MFGCEVEIGVRSRERRWAWDVEIAVEHGFPTFGSGLGGNGGSNDNLKIGSVVVW